MVVVVGAGICGLAAAWELKRRGRDVVVLEAEGVGAGQSLGEARIFRVAHRDERLCELALEARAGWRAWEREFGVELLGGEGLIVANGMWPHGEPLDREAIRARVPLLRADHPYDAGVWDDLAGSVRSRRALEALASRVEVRRATVTAVEADGTVHTGGERLRAEAVIVAAGLGTQALIDPLGLDLELTTEPHVRVTYKGPPGACLIAPDGYALPVGDRYAIGMHEPGTQPTAFDALEPVSEIECVSLFAPWLEAGDGFIALRAGRVIALGASNAMKFGPLIGARLADSALAGAGYGPEPWSQGNPRTTRPALKHP
jgi:sarcosine oxidase